MHTTLTSKGQMTLPKAARERLSLSTGQRLQVELTPEGGVLLTPVRIDALAITRALPRPRVKKPVTQAALDKAITQAATARLARSRRSAK